MREECSKSFKRDWQYSINTSIFTINNNLVAGRQMAGGGREAGTELAAVEEASAAGEGWECGQVPAALLRVGQ